MNNQKQIILIISALIFLALGYFVLSKKPVVTPIPNLGENKPVETSTPQIPEESSPELNAVTLQDKAWLVFQNYLDAAKRHDTTLVKNLSYQQSSTCVDPKTEADCFLLMDNLYSIGSKLKKTDYKNIWSDEKQIILHTDATPTQDGDVYGYKKGFIFFALDTTGTIKILALDPEQEWAVKKESNITDQQVQDKLSVFMLDTDQDGLTDRVEQCPTSASDLSLGCEKTDPNNRDTDGDGWWDGIEFYFYKK